MPRVTTSTTDPMWRHKDPTDKIDNEEKLIAAALKNVNLTMKIWTT